MGTELSPAPQQPAAQEAAAAPQPAPIARVRALAAALDRQPALLVAARALRRRLPGDDRFGDALSTGGAAAVQRVARGVSALRPERESFVRELGLTGLQLWQSLSEATGRGRGDRALAILFTDLVDFSSWALRAGDVATLQLLREVDAAHRAVIGGHRGEIQKRLGDGVMATFPTTQAAVEAALELQDAVAAIEVAGYRPRMRAGVHWGRPRKLGGDLLGVDVNVAARVADAAGPGEVMVTESTAKLIAPDTVRTGRARRLRAAGAPPGTFIQGVTRAG